MKMLRPQRWQWLLRSILATNRDIDNWLQSQQTTLTPNRRLKLVK